VTDDPRTWDDELLRAALDAHPDLRWGPFAVIPSTGSTNADAADQVGEGAPEGFVVVADEQTRGRGRLDRSWSSPPGAGLAMSLVLRPVVPEQTWGWLPLVAGVAAVDALREHGVPAVLTWPNDVMVDGPAHDGGPGPRKLGGILTERVGEAVVVGIGLNTDLDRDELPVGRATSTRLEGVAVRREQLLVSILDRLRALYVTWQLSGGDAVRAGTADAYAERCLMVGRPVRASLPGGEVLEGTAVRIGPDGSLVVAVEGGAERAVSAGDVLLVR
jgi:BirA family transcriptional regulator, biotin operon repressor / biotin---[acetyl-CoA-carboxylase] ligase